ncbi:hypothetical protein MLD38_026762 [Melastoma candidum]|uniref:Uncharacterized protein n=1 Tax=Melastoma candidum TaxID=119954 RepID=A0ACB9P0I5_9MYRT|nr:hypothetical protein MLD38_026762 [Melastoma candidum]
MQRFTVPQRLFLHFYAVAVIWTLLLIGATWIYAYNMEVLSSEPFSYSATIAGDLTKGSHSPLLRHRYEFWKSVLLLLLMEIHVLRRLLKSVFVFSYSPSARMHISCYLGALYYYIAAPLSLCCNILPEVLLYWGNVFSEMIMGGQGQMPRVGFKLWESVVPLIELGWHQWIGTTIFIWGWNHQRHCHKILGSLRKNRARDNEYVIPHGDWFEIVSGPHYLAEIVIYAGLFVASGASDVTMLLLLAVVVTNLTFAAAETHKWYKRKFENYPQKGVA